MRLLSIKAAGHESLQGKELLVTGALEELAAVNDCEHVKKVSRSKS